MKPFFGEYPSTGYFRNGIPYNRSGHAARPLLIFQGLVFENKPQALMTYGYGFLESEYTLFAVLRKPGMPQGYSLQDMANDYAEMIEQEFGAAVDVLGVSTGGSIAQHFAADHPEQLRRLVLHSSAHTLSDPGRQAQREVGRLAQQGQVEQAARTLVRFMLPGEGVWKYLSRPMVALGAWMMSHGSSQSTSDLVLTIEAEDVFEFKARLGQISAPTLVIAGAQDPFYTEALFRETAAGIPDAKLILYPKMRHPARGKQFAQDVLAFLTG